MAPAVLATLNDPGVSLVGFGINHELVELRRHGIVLQAQVVDMSRLFFTRVMDGDLDSTAETAPRTRLIAGGDEGHSIGAQQCIARVLGRRYDKPKGVQVSNWAVRPLGIAQALYAARDAAVARMTYIALRERLRAM